MYNRFDLFFKNLLLILLVTTSCGRKGNFAIQNCRGGEATIIIELGDKSVEVVPELSNKIIDNRIIFELKHNSRQEVFMTNFQELEKGLPVQLKIIRSNDSTLFHQGAEILPYLDTDVIGEIACCPFAICI